MPELVYIGLLGINSKNAAFVYLGISFLLALASVFAGFKNPVYFWGVGFFLSSFWYSYCINWVDKYSSWDN